jgi:hypothetical protein
MSKSIKMVSAFFFCLATIIPAFAEPAALGRMGVGGPEEPNAGNVACMSCSESSKEAPGADFSMGRAATPVRVTAFNANNGAGYAVLNGGDFEARNSSKDPVPEPATIGLVGAGLAALAFGLKRRG